MKYKKGTFVVIPNINILRGKSPEYLSVFFWLCSYANESGVCFPSRKRLAEDCGLTDRTIDKYLELLIEDSILEKKLRKKRGTKENITNLYQILLKERVANKKKQPSENNNTTCGETNNTVTIPNINYTNLTITLPLSRGNKPNSRVNSIYGTLYNYKYGFYPSVSNIGSRLKVITKLLEDYTEIQIAFLLIIYFNWEKDKKYFTDKSHDLFTFKFNIDKFVAYVLNESGYDVEWKDDELLLPIVGKEITKLTNAS